jgi:SAM-dependent methyltransferase
MTTTEQYGRFIAGDYLDYQAQYRRRLRENDRVLIEILRETLGDDPARVLDIGCSTGNLLYHLRDAMPALELVGGDLYEPIIEHCLHDPELAGITFRQMDITDLPVDEPYDAVVANIVLFRFDDEVFRASLRSIARALAPGGWFVAIDFYHEWDQDLVIRERSETHPEGLLIHVRPRATVRDALHDAGFEDAQFRPFHMPIDLPRPTEAADVSSHTRMMADGTRLCFRGSIHQPWCFVIARMPEMR